ncbi:sugar phosphate isomerase/epimerase family protein [Carboxydochorda subterranea]|uniref:Sugar phosphate isomerase/epimerase family protein n=1 Tax=Carboxydichorda subterranea TaxID=3109565 RepID=A0ABZ1BUY9_9FIRM|nr:sugar phosphate isomerase/epimerase family protein [Limnochorda sp. L945t]WRP16577.1 sugar phosphate isomerase/epimerase family protein [Limnochorda sp. L945t]
MRYSVCSIIMAEHGPEEAAELAGRYGYDGIEWRVHPGGHFAPVELPAAASRMRRLAEDHGLEIPALAAYVELGALGEGEEQALEELARVAEAAELAGARLFRVWAPAYDGSTPYGTLFDRARRGLEKAEAAARRHGVKAAVEIHLGGITPSAGLARRLVEGFDPAHVGLIHDPANLIYEGFENWRMGLELIGEYLAHVHVKNAAWLRGPDGRWRCESAPLAQGQVEWPAVAAELRRAGYDGWLSLEDFSGQPVEDRLRSGIAFLHHLGG